MRLTTWWQAYRPYSIYRQVQQLPVAAHCGSKPSQALIGKFETVCMLRIPLVAELRTNHIQKAKLINSVSILSKIFEALTITVSSERGRGWLPPSCQPCLPTSRPQTCLPLHSQRPPAKSNFVKRRFKRPKKAKKIPQANSLTIYLTSLRYSDRDVIQICNFQSFIHNPLRIGSSHVNNN